jgi:tetratricopeptide (TPR) repeat protein
MQAHPSRQLLTVFGMICCALAVMLSLTLPQSRAASETPQTRTSATSPADAGPKASQLERSAPRPAKDAVKSGERPKRGPGMVGISVEYDDIRCQTIQARYSIRIPAGAAMVDVDGFRLPLSNLAELSASPAPFLFLSRGSHRVRFRQNETAITAEIEKDFIDEYSKMRRFFAVDEKVRDRELLQRGARAMDVHGTPFLLNFWGAAYAAQDHWQAAERTFHRALAINPCFAPAHLNLAECLVRRGARDRASAEIDLAEVFNVANVFGITSAISQMRLDMQQSPARPSHEDVAVPNYQTSETISDQDKRVVGVLRALAKYAVDDGDRSKILNNIGAHFADIDKPEAALTYYRSALAVARGAGEDRLSLARQILSHMHDTCSKAGFDEAADYKMMMTLVSP